MADQIDHTAEAEAWLRGVDISDSLDTDALALAKAQVHATLALAEQARIANLIALFTYDGATSVVNDPVERGLFAMDGAYMILHPSVAAALKIGAPS